MYAMQSRHDQFIFFFSFFKLIHAIGVDMFIVHVHISCSTPFIIKEFPFFIYWHPKCESCINSMTKSDGTQTQFGVCFRSSANFAYEWMQIGEPTAIYRFRMRNTVLFEFDLLDALNILYCIFIARPKLQYFFFIISFVSFSWFSHTLRFFIMRLDGRQPST